MRPPPFVVKIFEENLSSLYDWIWIRSFTSFITSNNWLAIYNRGGSCYSWFDMVIMLERSDKMTIVVKKVPKFLRGFVKLIFGIKD